MAGNSEQFCFQNLTLAQQNWQIYKLFNPMATDAFCFQSLDQQQQNWKIFQAIQESQEASEIDFTNVAFVDQTSGDDATAEIGNPAKQFSTGTAALESGATIIQFGSGGFDITSPGTQIAGVTIRGMGPDATQLTIDTSSTTGPGGAVFLFDNASMVLTVLTNGGTTSEEGGGAGYDGGGVDLRGCVLDGVTTNGGVGISDGLGGYGNGGNPGSMTLRECVGYNPSSPTLVSAKGGNTSSPAFGGNGGYIYFYGCKYLEPSVDGGDPNVASGNIYAQDSNFGALSLIGNYIQMQGCAYTSVSATTFDDIGIDGTPAVPGTNPSSNRIKA